MFGGALTYVPGFWSWKGLVSTVWTLMMIAMLCVCEERRMKVEREEVKKRKEG